MPTIQRRRFLKSCAVAAGVTVIPSRLVYAQGKSAATSYAANEKLNIAGIGVGGQGGSHVGPSLRENLVAVCDASRRGRRRLPRGTPRRHTRSKTPTGRSPRRLPTTARCSTR